MSRCVLLLEGMSLKEGMYPCVGGHVPEGGGMPFRERVHHYRKHFLVVEDSIFVGRGMWFWVCTCGRGHVLVGIGCPCESRHVLLGLGISLWEGLVLD